MNILITGTNGFIGKHLVAYFSKDNNVITVTRKESIFSDSIKNYSWDIGNEEVPKELLNESIDIIIHSAACKDMNDGNAALVTSNCVGAFQIYELSKTLQIKKCILLSGIPIIGIPSNEQIVEEDLIAPKTMYHATKAAQEMILSQLSKIGIDSISLRIPSPIGPGQPVKTILPIFINKAMNNEGLVLSGKGTRRQNYIDVRDICYGIECLIRAKETNGVYNIGAPKTISNIELAEKVVELCNSKSSISFSGKKDLSDDQIWNVCIDKLMKATGYMGRYSLDQTIKDMIEEYKK